MIATMQFTTALCRRLNCFTLGSAGHYRRCWVPQHGSGRGAAHLPRPAETVAGKRLQTFLEARGLTRRLLPRARVAVSRWSFELVSTPLATRSSTRSVQTPAIRAG